MGKRSLLSVLTLITIGLIVNTNWVHAALVVASTESNCPEFLVDQSRNRVTELFGAVTSDPMLSCISETVLGLDVDYGTTRFAPGLPAVIVLGPKGTNVDVMAHEWAHAELASRTSALLRSYRVPTWFDEGLAMQLDHRSNYSRASLRNQVEVGTLEGVVLSNLSSPSAFFQAGEDGRAHYSLAKCVVSRWLEQPETDLQQLIDGVSWFNPIDDDALASFEAVCLN